MVPLQVTRANTWEAVGEVTAQFAGECGKLLPIALKSENVVKSTYTLPSSQPPMVLNAFDSYWYTALDHTHRRNLDKHRSQRRGRAESGEVTGRDPEPCSQSQVERPNDPRVDRQNRTYGTPYGSKQEAVGYDRRA